ncbi:MAG: hypothetical protein ACK5OS_01890 [Chryseotalea sp.]
MYELKNDVGIGSINLQKVNQGAANLVQQAKLPAGVKLNNTLTRINERLNQVNQIATNVRQTTDAIKGRATQAPPAVMQSGGSAMPSQRQSGINWKKILLIGTVAVVGGTGLYFGVKAYRKKKGLSGLGELNTAKTKSGKVKQRKAVFAKLDEAGKAWPKNTKGVRRKPVKRAKKKAYKTVKM